MREIKFRAYVSKESRYNIKVGMIDSENIKEMLQDKFTKIPAEWTWSEIGLIIMQYTGLKDNNGKEIYEHDILDCQDRVVTVFWNEQNGQWDSKFIKYKNELCSNGIENVNFKFRATIIGNIHEDKDLLK